MPDAFTGHDRIGLYLSGGASNQSPSGALGGLVSSRMIRGMAPQYIAPVEGVVIEDATPENLAGVGTVTITGSVAVYTPPDGLPGDGVSIAAGERKVLTGANTTKAIRLYRPIGAVFSGVAAFKLIDAMNGALSMGNVGDAIRVAGGTHYRAFFIKALANANLIKLWVETDGQSTYSLAVEVPSGDAVQTIATATTAPTGLTWEAAVSSGTALAIGTLLAGQSRGIWIRRVFPAAGTMAIKETVDLSLQHQGV